MHYLKIITNLNLIGMYYLPLIGLYLSKFRLSKFRRRSNYLSILKVCQRAEIQHINCNNSDKLKIRDFHLFIYLFICPVFRNARHKLTKKYYQVCTHTSMHTYKYVHTMSTTNMNIYKIWHNHTKVSVILIV